MRSPYAACAVAVLALCLDVAGAATAQTPPSSLIADPPSGSAGVDFGNGSSTPSPVTTGDREIEGIRWSAFEVRAERRR